jgi:hypothetical protein
MRYYYPFSTSSLSEVYLSVLLVLTSMYRGFCTEGCTVNNLRGRYLWYQKRFGHCIVKNVAFNIKPPTPRVRLERKSHTLPKTLTTAMTGKRIIEHYDS